ncbi:hypothetical protein QY903_11940 [Lactiplantibacillus paraplantarum]|uniref:hypothetical protein n=1 Tax=Lactiplantibacillus paraplantarum TaxID=60520 RepID=UPI00307A1DFF
MAKFRRLVLLSLSLGLALAGGCRSPDALAATSTDTSVTLTDWQAGTDLTNFQHPPSPSVSGGTQYHRHRCSTSLDSDAISRGDTAGSISVTTNG